MAIPGFTAEAAFYPTSNLYRIVGPGLAGRAKGITAQQEGWGHCSHAHDQCRTYAQIQYKICLEQLGCTAHYEYNVECNWAMFVCGDSMKWQIDECMTAYGC
jgi:hypothetical protein